MLVLSMSLPAGRNNRVQEDIIAMQEKMQAIFSEQKRDYLQVMEKALDENENI